MSVGHPVSVSVILPQFRFMSSPKPKRPKMDSQAEVSFTMIILHVIKMSA